MYVTPCKCDLYLIVINCFFSNLKVVKNKYSKMNYKYIYIIFSSLSLIFSADGTYKNQNSNFYNKSGKSKINLVNSNINQTTIEVILDGYEIKEIIDGEYKITIDKGTPILSAGDPDLPRLNTSIIIPDKKIMDVKIVESNYVEISDISIVPSKGNLSRDVNPKSIPYTYSNTYNQNSFYPHSLVNLGEPYILRGLRGQSVMINPIQFNPVTGVLRIYNRILINIYESKEVFNKQVKNPINRKIEQKFNSSKEFDNIYNNLFINYPQDLRFDYISDQGNMLIICYDDFISSMNPFVQWKNKKGIPTEIVPVSTIGNTVNDLQDYINNYYYNNGLTYLLLVGDAAQIPTHIVNGSASDPSYGFIEGDDAFSEILVGRFSGNNLSHIDTQVRRVVEYEKFENFDSSHLNKALGIASTQGPGYDGLDDHEFNDLIANDFLLEYTYDNYEGLYDSNANVSDGINAINEGVGLINYTGHAGPTGWGNGAPLNGNDVNNLANTNKLPFIFTVGCNPGQFNDYTECFCESWMWATDNEGNPTGAVGHLGSTISQSWEPPMHGQWAMNAILTESYNNNLSRSYGGIITNGCMHMNEAQGSNGINETKFWTLFGDPSMLIRTDEPQLLNPIYDNTILLGQSEFVVDIGQEGALVALSIDGVLMSYAYSNGGVAVLDISGISNNPQTIDMVISGFNNYPYESLIEVISADGPFLVFNNYELIEDSNSNNLIEYGEEIAINLEVNNIGNLNTNSVDVVLDSTDEYIDIINTNSLISLSIAGESSSTENPLVFSVLHNVPDGHIANFSANLNDGNNEWNMNFSIQISAPNFEIQNPLIIDGNQDGVWDVGESAVIQVDLINSGSAYFYDYPGATITVDSPYVSIESAENENTFFGIGPNSTYQGIFSVISDSQTPVGTEVIFTINWGYSSTSPCESDCLETSSLSYSAIIGHPSILVWDPTNEHLSGEKLIEFFETSNIEGYDYISSTDIESIENYSTVFVLLGVYPGNYVLQDYQAQLLIDLLDDGGNIYMEGADTWAFDTQTSVHDYFGLTGEADGSSDLSTIVGINGTFTEGFSFNYNSDNSYIDRIVPSGGIPILRNSDPEYTTAIAFENSIVGYRTIGSSHNLAGLNGEGFDEYILSILNFFNNGSDVNPECLAGDVNNDNNIDVIDVVRLVNLIINAGNPANDYELCASDINQDNLLNIQDVVIITNMILSNDRKIDFSRELDVDEVLIYVESNSLFFDTSGPIKGIQIEIESNQELYLNNEIDMEFAINKADNKYFILIYSLEGKSLESGSYKLFDSYKSFEINNFIAVNRNNEKVNVIMNENSIPQDYLLYQNYPNPFNPNTNIDISLSSSSNIQLLIFDLNGRLIKRIAEGNFNSGRHSFTWNGTSENGQEVSSGVYVYNLISNERVFSKKMLLLK